jgi:hypothetical protein
LKVDKNIKTGYMYVDRQLKNSSGEKGRKSIFKKTLNIEIGKIFVKVSPAPSWDGRWLCIFLQGACHGFESLLTRRFLFHVSIFPTTGAEKSIHLRNIVFRGRGTE